MNLHEFRRVLLFTFLLPVFALLVVSGVLFWQIRAADQAVGLVQQVDRNINRISHLENLIIDQETGLRGYQITKDARFLGPFNAASAQIPQLLDELEVTTRINPPQVIRTRNLRVAYMDWRASFAEPLLTQIQAGDDTLDTDMNLRGKAKMDDLRGRIAEMLEAAHLKRDQSVDVWQRQVHKTRLALLALALFVGLGIGLYSQRQMQRVSNTFQQSLQALQQRATKLFESEQRLRTTLHSIGDGVIVTDAAGCVELLNPVAEELTGWSNADAHGQAIESVFHIVNEETRLTVENPVAKVKRMNRVVGLANHTILIRRNGSELNIDDSGAPIRDEGGQMAGVVMVFRDVTTEKRTQAALLSNEKLAVAGRLAATIAHEIHNPLDSVANLLYLMRNGLMAEDEREHFLNMADQELARVTQISRAMLSLYRESKTPVKIDLKEMLESLLVLVEHNIVAAKVAETTNLPVHITVEGYPAELRQVFTNLITNAYEAAGAGGTLRIDLGEDSHGSACVKITNSGPPIEPKVREKLFQPFFSTKGEKGTGLGLWVSQGIVQKHGGRIEIESPVAGDGTGTRVSVVLPQRFTTPLPQNRD